MNNEPDYDNLYFERKPMTQKIFDTDNAEDMALLWNILPDFVNKIKRNVPADYYLVHYKNNPNVDILRFIKINWHDKTEITRPIPEATEKDIYKLCCFWDSEYNPNAKIVGCLSAILPFGNVKYVARGGLNYKHCRRLTKQEIEELC
jgi:hypothetical protein